MKKCSDDFSKGKTGSAHGAPPAFNSKNLGSSTSGKHDAGIAKSGEVGKVGSVADGHGKSDSMGKATGTEPGKASTSMDTIRKVADGK
jgi:hypothetical protein